MLEIAAGELTTLCTVTGGRQVAECSRTSPAGTVLPLVLVLRSISAAPFFSREMFRCSWSGLANCRGGASCRELSMRMGVVIVHGSSARKSSLRVV